MLLGGGPNRDLVSIEANVNLAHRLADELIATRKIEAVRVWLTDEHFVIPAAENPDDWFGSKGLTPDEVSELIFSVSPLASERGFPLGISDVRFGFVEIANAEHLAPDVRKLLERRIQATAAAMSSASTLARAESERRGRVLVVDDDEALRGLLQKLLTRERFEIIEAADGDEGIEKAASEQPDLILLDWIMPHMDGREAARALKADSRTSAIPIVMLTGRSRAQDKVEALRSGVQDFVAKPFDYRELVSRIETQLRWRRLLASDGKPTATAAEMPTVREPRNAMLDQLVRLMRTGEPEAALEGAIAEAERYEERKQPDRAGASYKIASDAARVLANDELAKKLLRLSGRAYLNWAHAAIKAEDSQRGYTLSVRRFIEAGNIRVAD